MHTHLGYSAPSESVKDRKPQFNMRTSQVRGICVSALLAIPAIVSAQATIQATLNPVDLWGDGNYFSKFLSSEALLTAKNSYSENQFNSCMTYYAAANSKSYQCGKLVMTGIRSLPSVYPQLINGKYVLYMVNATWFYEGQNGDAPISYSTDASNYYAVQRSPACPQLHPYSATSVSNGDNSTLLTCVSYKTPPLQCTGRDAGKSAGAGAPGGVGNPIQIYGGVKTESQTDYADPRGLLLVQRQFMGQTKAWRMPGDARLIDTYSAAQSLQSISETTSGTTLDGSGSSISTSVTLTFPFVRTADSGEVYLANPDGSLARHVPGGAGTFPADVSGDTITHLSTPTADGATWRVQRANNVVEEFGPDGRQRRQQLPTGAFVLFQYSDGALTRTVDNWGRQITYTPGDSGVPVAVGLPDGSTISYSFQGRLLTGVTYPDSTARQFLYNEAAYSNAGSFAPYALTGSIDENGVRVGSYYYDTSARRFRQSWPVELASLLSATAMTAIPG